METNTTPQDNDMNAPSAETASGFTDALEPFDANPDFQRCDLWEAQMLSGTVTGHRGGVPARDAARQHAKFPGMKWRPFVRGCYAQHERAGGAPVCGNIATQTVVDDMDWKQQITISMCAEHAEMFAKRKAELAEMERY